jgi:hypothetical protein
MSASIFELASAAAGLCQSVCNGVIEGRLFQFFPVYETR